MGITIRGGRERQEGKTKQTETKGVNYVDRVTYQPGADTGGRGTAGAGGGDDPNDGREGGHHDGLGPGGGNGEEEEEEEEMADEEEEVIVTDFDWDCGNNNWVLLDG